MADNYLERRIEDYHSGRLGGKPRIGSKSGRNRNLVLIGEPDSLSVAIIDMLKREGRVILCGDDSDCYRRLAQQSGARLYPQDEQALQMVTEDFGKVDALVLTSDYKNYQLLKDASDHFVIVSRNVEANPIFSYLKSSPDTIVLGVENIGSLQAVAGVCALLTSRNSRYLNGICVTPVKF